MNREEIHRAQRFANRFGRNRTGVMQRTAVAHIGSPLPRRTPTNNHTLPATYPLVERRHGLRVRIDPTTGIYSLDAYPPGNNDG